MPDAKIGLEVNVESNSSDLDKTIGKVEALADGLTDLGKDVAAIGRAFDKMAQGMGQVNAKQIENAARATRNLASAQTASARAMRTAAQEAARYRDLPGTSALGRRTTPVATDHVKGTQESGANLIYLKQQLQARNGITQEMIRQRDLLGGLASAQQSLNRATKEEVTNRLGSAAAANRAAGRNTGTGMGSARDVASRMEADALRLERNELKVLQGEHAAARASLGALRGQYDLLLGGQRNLVARLQEEEAVTNRLTNARYAMFAAGASVLAGSYAIGGAMLAATQAAMEYETALAQIERTSGMSGTSLQNFAGTLREMSSTIPLAFGDIAEIATLGGQLNIAETELEGFTRSVSQFSMTTNVTADAAAEAFGRINGLVPGVNDNFDALGSAILNVGVNSVATESDIIATATQIAAVGAQAGFTADEVIGFAGAMRSVGLNPYLSRGGLTRIFGQISAAIAEGGAQLDTFAGLSGRSAEQFSSDWRDQAATTFVDLLKGMEGARQGGEDLYQVMGRLGIVNSQDQQVLAVLSQNYDELTSAIGYANQGFTDGTQLQDAFAVQADTVASKLTMLVNSLHAMFSVLAGPALAPIGFLAEHLAALAQGITEVVSNSTGLQVLIGVIGGLATAGAGVGIAVGAFTLFVAASIAARTAMRTLKTEMEISRLAIMEQRAATMLNTSAQAQNVAETTRRIAAQRALVTSLGGAAAAERAAATATLGTTAAISASNAQAVTGVSKWSAYSNVLFGSGVAATGFGRALSGVMALAGGPVGIAIMGAATALTAYDAAQRAAYHSTEQWYELLRSAPTAEEVFNFADSESLPGADDLFGLAPSNNFSFIEDLERLPAMLARTSAAASNFWENFNMQANQGMPLGELTTQLGRINEALSSMPFGEMQAAFASIAQSANLSDQAAWDMINSMSGVKEAILAAAEAQGVMLHDAEGNINTQLAVAFTYGEVGNAAHEAGMVGSEAMYYLADSTGAVGAELRTVADALASDFALPTMLSEMGNAMRDFAIGIAEGGMNFAAVSAAGGVNVANFQALVASAIIAGQSQGVSAANSVNALFQALKAQGMDVMAILGALKAQGMTSGIGGVAMAQLEASASAAQGPVTGLAEYMRTSFANAQARAAQSVQRTSRALGGGGGGRGGGGGGGSRPRSGLAGAARAAAIEVRNLTDYAGDLKKVMGRAFDIRFGGAQSFDKITEGWLDIAEATAQATEAIAEANREIDQTRARMMELTADRAIQMYFRDMAVEYEDFLRAGELTAKIAGIDADLADANAEIAKSTKDRTEAEGDLNKGLVGNSKSAIDNRATVLDLASSYQDYLVALASSGVSQGELAAKAQELKRDFIAQGLAAGYSADELDVYAKSFDDLATIIARVPYNVTVAFNGDPALLALAEFDAELAAKAAQAGRNAGSSLGGGIASGLGSALGGLGGIGGLADFGDLFPDPFELPEFNIPPTVKKFPGKAPEEPIKQYKRDPFAQKPDPAGARHVGGGGNFDKDESGAPIYSSDGWWGNIQVGVMRAIVNGVTEANIGQGVKQGKVGAKIKDALGREVQWGVVGTDAGNKFGLGAKGAVTKVRLGGDVNNEIKRVGWTTTGSLVGTNVGSALKLAYSAQRVGPYTLDQVKDADWTSRGGSVGRGFGSSLKTGFSSQSVAAAMINSVKGADWSSGGVTSGNKFGGGIKRGVSDAKTADGVLNAATGGGWYSRGHGQGGDLADGVKVGFSSKSPGSSLLKAVSSGWYDIGWSAGRNFVDGVKAGFNSKAAQVKAGSDSAALKMSAYQQGGWTGGTGRNDIAGYVHGQEFVMPASATQKLGLANLEYMRHTGTMPGNGGSMTNGMTVIAELSPTDRALLRAAGDVQLQLTGGAIASVNGNANVAAVRRGGN